MLIGALGAARLCDIGLHGSYASTILPSLVLAGIGLGLSTSPAFASGTLGLPARDAGVGSAALNTSQQIGGSFGTALINTLAVSAAAAFLVGRASTAQVLSEASLHSYHTAFLWSADIFVVGAIIAAVVYRS
jgi:curli biogenesis system outer membrane secretion channel CsgG